MMVLVELRRRMVDPIVGTRRLLCSCVLPNDKLQLQEHERSAHLICSLALSVSIWPMNYIQCSDEKTSLGSSLADLL